MPSTSTDTPMPSASARPSAARVSPASGAGTDTCGKNRAGTHTTAQPEEREHPPAGGPRQPLARWRRTAAPPRRRAAPTSPSRRPAGPSGTAGSAERSRSGRNAKPSDAGSTPVCAYASGHGNSSTSAPRAVTIASPNARTAIRAARDRRRHDEGGRRDHEETEADGVPHREQRGEDGEARARRPRRGIVVATRAAPRASEERQQREQHERAEPTLRDRVARHRVDAVREPGRERRTAEADEATGEPVRTERTERDREHDDERLREADGTEQHGAERAHQRQRRRRRRRRAETRCSATPSRSVEQVADARPVTERTDGGDPVRDAGRATRSPPARGSRGTRPPPACAHRRTRCRPHSERRRPASAAGRRCAGGATGTR